MMRFATTQSDAALATREHRCRHTRLAYRAPAMIGALGVVATLGAAAWAAASMPIAYSHTVVPAKLARLPVVEVRHDGGAIAKIHVTKGEAISAGQLLATRDAGDIDAKISALRAQSQLAQSKLEAVRREALAFNVLLEQRLVSRAKVTELEQQSVTLERETADVLAHIGEAERQLERLEIRSPATGIVEIVAVQATGSDLPAGATLAAIRLASDRFAFEAPLNAAQARLAMAGEDVRLWIDPASWRDGRPLRGKVISITPLEPTDRMHSSYTHIAHGELDFAGSSHSAGLASTGLKASLVVRSPPRTLLDQLVTLLPGLAERIDRSSTKFSHSHGA